MFKESIAGFGATRLHDGAGHPAVALVVHGIGPFQVGEAAVLRLEWGLQVGRVINGVGPGVAGEQLEALGESLREVESQSVVPGVAIGELRVDAVEGNGNTEALRVASQCRQGHLRCVTTGDQSAERRIRAGGPKEVEEGRCGHESDGRYRIAIRGGEALTESARSNQANTTGTRRDT